MIQFFLLNFSFFNMVRIIILKIKCAKSLNENHININLLDSQLYMLESIYRMIDVLPRVMSKVKDETPFRWIYL